MATIEIRKNGAYGETIDRTEAVRYAMGADRQVSRLVVTQVPEPGGEPVRGTDDIEIYARRVQFGEDVDAKLSMAGIGSHSPEVAMVRAECYMLAAQIAAAANAAAAMIREQAAG